MNPKKIRIISIIKVSESRLWNAIKRLNEFNITDISSFFDIVINNKEIHCSESLKELGFNKIEICLIKKKL